MAKGAYKALIQYPTVKDVPKNDWQEYDGIEVDLSHLPFAPREFSLTFEFSGPNVDVSGFVNLLGGSTITLNSVEAGVQKSVRCLGFSTYTTYERGATVAVRFVEDLPSLSEAELPEQTIPTDNRFKLDDMPFSRFNVRILKGSEAAALKPADIKQYLTRSSKYTSGQTYDNGGYKVLKERDVTLQCLMTADSIEDFRAFYDALLYGLTYENEEQYAEDPTTTCERRLYVGLGGKDYKCYYKSQSVNGFYPFGSSKIWCQFALTLCLVGDDLEFFDLLLAAENDYLVITEDGKQIRV